MISSSIIAFGRYLPKYRISTATIAAQWGQDPVTMEKGLGVRQKTVPGKEEDSFTMAFEACTQALEIAQKNSKVQATDVSAVFAGSESHPYAVKPTSAMLADALKVDPYCFAADLEFACKAGTAGIQIVQSFVESGKIRFGLAVGTDTAQGRPGDALEYTAAAGAAAMLIGSAKQKGALCSIDRTLSFTTDTPDFWRAEGDAYPRHAGRFTGEPGYFHHVRTAITAMLETERAKATDFAHVVLHMPNAKFPKTIAKECGFSDVQMKTGFIVPEIGNTYSACSLLGLTYVLESARKGERILLVSYGSGAGADAFALTMLRDGIPLPPDSRETVDVSYGAYAARSIAGIH